MRNPIIIDHLPTALLKKTGFIMWPIDHTEEVKYKSIAMINGI